MKSTTRSAFLLTAAFVLGACATRPAAVEPSAPENPVQAQERRTQASRPTYNLSGYPPSVREGYIDGCESAKRSQYGRKDAQRFAGDAQYQMGWNDGYSICGRK